MTMNVLEINVRPSGKKNSIFQRDKQHEKAGKAFKFTTRDVSSPW